MKDVAARSDQRGKVRQPPRAKRGVLGADRSFEIKRPSPARERLYISGGLV